MPEAVRFEDTRSASIRLVVSDVDGTLLTSDKSLTPRTVAAVQGLEACGIRFAVTSSRPPHRLATLVVLAVDMLGGAGLEVWVYRRSEGPSCPTCGPW